MNLTNLKIVLSTLGVQTDNLKANTKNWCQVPCVLAKWFHEKHTDSRASCSIKVDCSPSAFVCFSCGSSGKLWSLVESYAILSGRDDLRKLADKIFESDRLTLTARLQNISWESESFVTTRQVYNIELLEDFPPASIGALSHAYLKRRGIPIDVANKFELVYDRTRNRIVFPVKSRDGKLRGAVGRSLNDEEKNKYYNYWNFEATKNLGGEQFIDHETKYIVIAEGFFDVLNSYETLREEEISVVCTFRCELSEYQVALLTSLDKNIWIVYDNDKAGRRGTEKAIESLKGKVVNLKYYTPPEGVDLGAMSREQILTTVNMMKRRKLVKFS